MNSKTPSALSRCWWALWLINMFFGLEAVASGLVSVQRLSSHLRPVALTENNRIQTHTRAVIIWPFWAGCMINCLLGHLILTPGAGGGGGRGVPYQYLRPDPRPWVSSSTENEACRCNIPELPVAREGTTHSQTLLSFLVCVLSDCLHEWMYRFSNPQKCIFKSSLSPPVFFRCWSVRHKKEPKSYIKSSVFFPPQFLSWWRIRLGKQIWGCSQKQNGFPAAGPIHHCK